MARFGTRRAVLLGAANRAWQMGSAISVLQNTGRSNDMTPDGYTWAQGGPMVIDNYGNLIANIQHYGAASAICNAVTVSGDNGATWSDPTLTGWFSADGEQFLVRGAFAYDSVNDKLHVLWVGGATDGVIYRRYGFTRDGGNKITAMTKDAVNLQLDYQGGVGTMDYQHPCLLWLNTGGNGTLVACWSARNSGGAPKKSEIRMAKRALTNTTADGAASSWVHLGTSATTTITQTPVGLANGGCASYSCPFSFNNSSVMYVSAGIKRSGAKQWDITLLYADGGTDPIWYAQFCPYLGSITWNTGNGPTSVSNVRRSGTDGGYNQKSQLGTEPRHDTSTDRMYFGIATWDGTGDTWSFAYQTPAGGVSALVDAYVAPGAHCSADDFVTGDLAVFNDAGVVMATWTDLPAKDTWAALYDLNGARIGSPSKIFNTAPCDIPTLYPDRLNGAAGVLFRDFNVQSVNNPPVYTPPYRGYYVRVPIVR